MTSNRFVYFILAAFIASALLLYALHSNSRKGIRRLVEGNEQLALELRAGNALRQAERNILSSESRVRAAVATRDTGYLAGVGEMVAEAESNLDTLRKFFGEDSIRFYLNRLAVLGNRKRDLSNELLYEYRSSGRFPINILTTSTLAKRDSNQVDLMTRNIYRRRQASLVALQQSISEDGRQVQRLEALLVVVGLISGAIFFWFIINQIRHQNKVIRQLDNSERKLQEAVRIKENFLANMSHEIRTPLNSIIGFARLLSKKPLDADSEEFVSAIRDSGENLLSIINDILDLSKIEAGMIRVDARPFAVRELFHSVETLFYHRVRERGLYLNVDVAADVPEILMGDATRLTQIAVNLIGNAAKFTETGGISIRVSSDRGADKDDVRLWVAVADTGIGISRDQITSIFERFSQAESSTTRKYGGTGLGLTIVKELIEIQHGKIEVESERGKGTTFRLFIPYKIVAAAPELADVPENVIAALPRMEGTRVLVADDNRMNQRLMEHLLGGAGLTFDIVDDGQKAVNRLREKKYHLVLMDIQMPVVDGYAASRMIREDLRSKVPIIAMTAHAMRGEREKCLESGMNEYLSKPIDAEELFRMIGKFMDPSEIDANTVGDPEPVPKGDVRPEYNFETINVAYLQDLSGGDREYEIGMVEQFLQSVPEELGQLRVGLATNDLAMVSKVAHNMKTTVSIMGMNEQLSGLLDQLEYPDGDTDFMTAFGKLQLLCERAMEEARLFHSTN